MQTARLIVEIQVAAIPALRVAFTIAVLLLAGAGLFIYHKRQQFFDRDPQVEDDTAVAQMKPSLAGSCAKMTGILLPHQERIGFLLKGCFSLVK